MSRPLLFYLYLSLNLSLSESLSQKWDDSLYREGRKHLQVGDLQAETTYVCTAGPSSECCMLSTLWCHMVNSFATSKFCCPALLHRRRLMCVQCRWNSNTTLEWLPVDVWIPRGERLRHSDHCWQDGRSRPPGSTSVFHCPGRRKLRRCVPRYRTYLLPWLDRALILLGLTLCLPSASVSSVFVVLCVYIYIYTVSGKKWNQ